MLIRTPITSLIVFMLVVWRVTHLLWAEDGPGDIFVRLRRLFGASFPGRLLDCFYCLSLWIAAPVAWLAGNSWAERGILWLSFSGGAILLERATAKPSLSPPSTAQWHEEPLKPKTQEGEPGNVMLR